MPTITVPAKLDNLEPAKDYLKAHIPPEFSRQTSNVLLVAEELLVNVFSYAYPEGAEGRAAVSLEATGDRLVFTVKDWGAAFNPFEEVPDPDLTLDLGARPLGGLGIFLIKQVSESQAWRYEGGANIITIGFGKAPKEVP